MADVQELARRFTDFASTAAKRAPLYTRLAHAAASDPRTAGLLRAAPELQQMPVLLFAAVHHLLLAGHGPELAAHYPNLSDTTSTADVEPVFLAFAHRHADELRAIIAVRNTQTNEVGRSAQFLPAFGLLDAECGSLSHIDVGASAGLNLAWPKFEYLYTPGNTLLGGPSAVRLECSTRGTPPLPSRLPELAGAVGLDIAPIDVADDDAVRWLEACVWPDQRDRFERLVAAIEIARANPPDVRRGDAIRDVGALVHELVSRTGGHPVITTSWVLSYFSEDEQRRFVDALDDVGRQRDLSWVVAESPAQTTGLPIPTSAEPEGLTVLSLVRWRSGRRSVHRLATTHPHGFWLHWER